MDQLDSILTQRKKRKSISQIQYNKASHNLYKLSPLYQNIRQNHLNNFSGEAKKSIIKINKKKLPLDFFINQNGEQMTRKTLDLRQKQKKETQFNLPIYQKKISSEKYIQNDRTNQLRNQFKSALNQIKQEDDLKNTCFFGNSDQKNRFNNKNMFDYNVQQNKQLYQRNYQTRSQQKRQKIQFQERKFTAKNNSQKQDILQILPIYKQKLQNQINDIIVFTGAFAKQLKHISGRTSPTKDLLTPIKQKPEKINKLQNRQKYFNLKLNLNDRKIIQSQFNSPLISQRQVNSPLIKIRQLNSPLKQQKQPITPIKIFNNQQNSGNLYDSQIKLNFKKTNESLNSSQPTDVMNVTFFNSKSSVLPPIINQKQ